MAEIMSLDAATACRLIVRQHARTFWIASRFLPADKQRAAFALYAFCRTADDIVDTAPHAATRTTQLLELRHQLFAALDGRAVGPVFRELARAVERYHVPHGVLVELVDGVARDCAPVRYTSWGQLSTYCEGVASSVGEMCTYVFGVTGGSEHLRLARQHARTLGVAMQLTNILRDVGEDARNGRCYLPDEDLAKFGINRAEVLHCSLAADERWKALMRFEIARARTLYAQATPGIALLAPDARRCASACATGYARILGAIEGIDYDTFSSRAQLGSLARAAVLWSTWRAPLASLGTNVSLPPFDHDTTHAMSA